MSSEPQSPPRKRSRSKRSAVSAIAAHRATMIKDDVEASLQDSLNSSGGACRMRVPKKAKSRRPRDADAAAPAMVSPCSSNGSATTSEVMSFDPDLQGLLKQVRKRGHQLSALDKEVVRVVAQHLESIGLHSSAEVLMRESGCKLDQPSAALFKKFIVAGDWSKAVTALDDLQEHLQDHAQFVEIKFQLLEQKYLELLSHGQHLDALKVLQTELTPLKHNQHRTHELSTFLMYSSPDELAHVAQSAVSGSHKARFDLMERLQASFPPTVMLPPRRLLTLLSQATEFQTECCLYHNRAPGSVSSLDLSYLAVDHMCSKQTFPSETVQVLNEHCDEVCYAQFSPDGIKLASGSKDSTVIIWHFNPDAMSLQFIRRLEMPSIGVSLFAWSPDSRRLAVCGQEDSKEIVVWNVDNGSREFKISHSSSDSLTTVSWCPDGVKLVCGGVRGQFYQCGAKGEVLDSWEGVRVQCLMYRKDGKSVLAADTHHRIRSYNFEELSDRTILQEDFCIPTFTVDDADRHALVNISGQGVHLWDIQEKCLIRKFQAAHSAHCCFGGADQHFVACGTDDNKIFIYHIKKESPIVVLSGHSSMVHCVSWNPVYTRVLVSASADGTLRLWGPAEQFRTRPTEPLSTD